MSNLEKFSADGQTYTDPDGVEYPAHEEGVAWPNHLHKNAEYPSSEIRMKIMRELLSGDTHDDDYSYGEHPAYPFVLKAMHKLLDQSDSYLFRQYYHRDLAIKALNEGDTELALNHLRQIGV